MTGDVIVAGDFNAKSPEWGSSAQDRRGTILADFAFSLGLSPTSDSRRPTFVRGNSSSVIDIALASPGVARRVVKSEVLTRFSASDHRYILHDVQNQRTTFQGNQAKGWCWRKLDRDRLVQHIMSTRDAIGSAIQNNSPEVAAQRMIDEISEACDASMPRRKTGTWHKKATFWWNDEIAQLRKQCCRSRRVLQRARRRGTATEDLRATYKGNVNALKKAIKNAKIRSWEALCGTVDSNPWGMAYKVVLKNIKGRGPLPVLHQDQAEQIIDTLFPSREVTAWELNVGDAPVATPFSEPELLTVTRRMQAAKAPGLDGIPNAALKIIAEESPSLLISAYNRCLETGTFPDRWKRQRMILIPKKGKDPGSSSAYRPLCLIDGAAKILEGLIANRLAEEIEANGALSPRQFGFRKGRSATDAILAVCEYANTAQRRKELCGLVTVDVANAFSSLDWDTVGRTLKEWRISPQLLCILADYFKRRSLVHEVVGGEIHRDVTAGVPQGSVLGPLIWNVVYDGVLRLNLPTGCETFAYADDLALLVRDKKEDGVVAKATEALHILKDWLATRGLLIAPGKTEATILTNRKKGAILPQLELDGHIIRFKRAIRYLGVQLDMKRSFFAHASEVNTKALRVIGALSRLMPNIGGPSFARRKLYVSVALSIILYAVPVWASRLEIGQVRNAVVPALRTCAQRASRAYRTVPLETAGLIACIPPIHLIARERTEQFARMKMTDNQPQNADAERTNDEVLAAWQHDWDRDKRSVWTHRLIPSIRPWVTRGHGVVTFYITQMLTGHGCFGRYLSIIGKEPSAACWFCGHHTDNAEHTFYHCTRWSEERRELFLAVGEVTPENTVAQMLRYQAGWGAVTKFATDILRTKEAEERLRRRRQAGGGHDNERQTERREVEELALETE